MRDRFVEFDDGTVRAVSDMSNAELLRTLADVECELAGDLEGVDGDRYEGDASPEALRERLLVELVARGMKAG